MATLQQAIQNYSEIENAVSSGGGVSQDNPYLSQYNSYQAQQATLEADLKNQKIQMKLLSKRLKVKRSL